MDAHTVSRKRRVVWGERKTPAPDSVDGSPSNWSSVLVEELLATNVIADRNMAILKEQGSTAATIDPVLMSDVRHDKDIRSTLLSSRSKPSNAEILTEAKRLLKREETTKKAISMQNKIVDDEVDRFQNHITSLRKMNKRLERMAIPATKVTTRKQNKFQYERSLNAHASSECVTKFNCMLDERVMFPEQEKLRRKCRYPNVSSAAKIDDLQEADLFNLPSKQRTKSNLSIFGQKMDEHDILHHNPTLVSQALSECQNTVFERIHQKYIESERNRVLNEGAACIRHSSPINDSRHAAIQCTDSKSLNLLPTCNDSSIHLGEWIEDTCHTNDLRSVAVQKSEVCIDEWCLPIKAYKGKQVFRRTEEAEKSESPTKTLPPAVASKKEQNKLESMSKMYAKWMSKVCVSPNSCFEDSGSLKNKLEKDREGSSNKPQQTNINSVTREEKIMQVLQALQKHKEGKTSNTVNPQHTRNSRFSKSVNDVREEKAELEGLKSRRAISGSYENRLKAHKELITHQKVKLDDQKKQIEELKLSQLRMESEKSQMLTQRTLNEVLGTCNENVKAQAKSLKSSLSLADLSPGNDFVLRMERRALEQKQKKLLSQERRKQMEEDRKRKIKEMVEKKHQEEEELMKKKHDEAREMRRKERELREDARKERENIIALERKADQFLQNKRLRFGLLGFKKILSLRKMQEEIAMEFYDNYLMRFVLRVWKGEVEVRLKAKMDCADYFYSSNLLHCCFNALKMEVQERTRRTQVAMDMHDLHLEERFFRLWLKFTQEQQEIEAEKAAKADLHFSKVLLRRHLYLWQKYPNVAQLEREKERRKMMWRNKVQQLLPDFRPILSSD